MINSMFVTFFCIMFTLFALLNTTLINIHLVKAQSNVEEINGFGDSLERFECADGQRPPSGTFPNEAINFNAIETAGGETSGEFIISGVDTGGTKEGQINTIDINGEQFTITGTETIDTLCQDTVPTEIT